MLRCASGIQEQHRDKVGEAIMVIMLDTDMQEQDMIVRCKYVSKPLTAGATVTPSWSTKTKTFQSMRFSQVDGNQRNDSLLPCSQCSFSF